MTVLVCRIVLGNVKKILFFVKQSLIDAGFLINEESFLVPTQKFEWLGILWDSQLFSLSILDKSISDTFMLDHTNNSFFSQFLPIENWLR